MKNVFRDYECDGLCGTPIPIPADCAAALLCPNGNKRPNAFLACGSCQAWLDDVTNDAELTGIAVGETNKRKGGSLIRA
jgi:polyferredoxin